MLAVAGSCLGAEAALRLLPIAAAVLAVVAAVVAAELATGWAVVVVVGESAFAVAFAGVSDEWSVAVAAAAAAAAAVVVGEFAVVVGVVVEEQVFGDDS